MIPRTTTLTERDDASIEMLADQRDANEALVLEVLRSHELADSAHVAQLSAENEIGAAELTVAELRAVADVRELLIGVLGHDLRNPLSTVLGASALLLARGGLNDADAQLVARIINSGQRMTRMIAQVLEFTRARLGNGFPLDRARVDLGQVCTNVVDELRISSGTDVQVKTEGDLAGYWDADRLAAVISNIAGNAIDHAYVDTAVLVRVYVDADRVVAEISNHGPVIPPEMLSMVFEAFRQGTSWGPQRSGDPTAPRSQRKRKSDTEHLGLGLFISHEIARAHGGTLEVRSDADITTFTLRLPRGVPPIPPSGAELA